MARASSTILSRSGKSGYSCLTSDLRGESIQTFTFKNDVSCECIVGDIYEVDGVLLYPK